MINPPSVEPYSWTIGTIANNISYVKRGVKPIAEFQTHNLYLDDCLEEIKKSQSILCDFSMWRDTYGFIFLSKEVFRRNCQFCSRLTLCNNIFMTWVEGKMFGYSDESICEYIYEKIK